MEKEVKTWMSKLGFQDNTDAAIPNFYLNIETFMNPNLAMQQVAKKYPRWDPLDDISIISPQLAMYFYLLLGDKGESNNP